LLGEDLFGGLEGVQGAVRDPGGEPVDAFGNAVAQRGEGQRGDLLAGPGLPATLQLPAGAQPVPVRVQAGDQLG